MSRKKYGFFRAVMTVLLLTAGWCRTDVCAQNTLPFEAGEILEYKVSWENIRAGKVKFKTLPLKGDNDQNIWHFFLEVSSTSFVDMFYKIRDELQSHVDKTFTQAQFYSKTQHGKEKRQITVEFDWNKKQAVYSNFGRKKDPIGIPSDTLDPLSAFYKMRTFELDTFKPISFPVTDGKKYFIQKGQVLEKQTLTIKSGTYDTYVIAFTTDHLSGVFEKSQNPSIMAWVSADDRKIPVRIKIKVFIGSIIFDLVSATG